VIVSCRIEAIESMIDTEDSAYVPEVAGDLLARCSEAVLRMFAAMPDEPGA
jgi:hypothetical protein